MVVHALQNVMVVPFDSEKCLVPHGSMGCIDFAYYLADESPFLLVIFHHSQRYYEFFIQWYDWSQFSFLSLVLVILFIFSSFLYYFHKGSFYSFHIESWWFLALFSYFPRIFAITYQISAVPQLCSPYQVSSWLVSPGPDSPRVHSRSCIGGCTPLCRHRAGSSRSHSCTWLCSTLR